MNKSLENSPREPREEIPVNIEVEKIPHYIIMITRHADRLPSGELSPDGVVNSEARGERLKDVEVLKRYASDHPSGRTYETAENISKKANVKSPVTGERYETRKVKGIQYDVLDQAILENIKLLIEEATIEEINNKYPELAHLINSALSEDASGELTKTNLKGEVMADIEKLPKEIQRQIAPIRQKYQKVGFEKVLNDPRAVKDMAEGLSHQLVGKEKILARYSKSRKNAPIKKDVVIGIDTHGLFIESLLKKAGILIKSNGEEIHDMGNMDIDELGGYIQPTESIYLDIGHDPSQMPNRIPVIFETERHINGRVYIDRSRLEQLNKDYIVNKNTQQE